MTALARLKSVLRDYSGPELDILSHQIGIEPRLVMRACTGLAINASAHLRLCAGLDLDPAGGETHPPLSCGDLHAPSLSAALRIARYQLKLGIRGFAKRCKVSYSTIGRIERGDAVSIDKILKVCRFLKRDPFDFVSDPVARETATEIRSAA